jgi:FkbH-like protein
MYAHQPAELLDHVKLMASGRNAPQDVDSALRVALLGFCTTRYYALVLRGLGETVGTPVVTYESEYDTVDQTVLDDASGLYAFRPDFAVFVTAVQTVRAQLAQVDIARRVASADAEVERILSLARRVAEANGITVLIHEFVVPYERPWGNLTRCIDGSMANVVARMNARLREFARTIDNVYTMECDHIAAWSGKQTWFDERLWFYSKSFCHPDCLPRVAGNLLDILRAVKGRGIKCIALDLDNTLWGGIIGDDGLEGIRLGELGDGEAYVHFQAWLKQLRKRGIILGVCSKNDEDKAREPFQRHPDMILREDDISCFIANWDDKATNLQRMAAILNIGLSSILFLDDSNFERDLVRQMLPEVCVPEMPEDPSEYVPHLESLNLFEAVQFSDEDRKRTEFYRANVQRHEEQHNYADVNDYLVGLDMTAAFERFDEYHMPRIGQLVQRTNQFNLTTIRHSVGELNAYAKDPHVFPYYTTLEDKFGDNGLVSVVIGSRDGDSLDIVTWLMSCRVMSRRLEEFVLDQLVEVARGAGVLVIRGRYSPTKKNRLVADHYEKLGFRQIDTETDGTTVWELDVNDHTPSSAPIKRKDADSNGS